MKTTDNKGFSKSDLAQKRLFTRPSVLGKEKFKAFVGGFSFF